MPDDAVPVPGAKYLSPRHERILRLTDRLQSGQKVSGPEVAAVIIELVEDDLLAKILVTVRMELMRKAPHEEILELIDMALS